MKLLNAQVIAEMHPVDYYSLYTKNYTGELSEQEVRKLKAFYYAVCAGTGAMLGR